VTETRQAQPVSFWQSVQWQIATCSGSASASNRMRPQWQLPWTFIVHSSCSDIVRGEDDP
jgi:hypothetical protein